MDTLWRRKVHHERHEPSYRYRGVLLEYAINGVFGPLLRSCGAVDFGTAKTEVLDDLATNSPIAKKVCQELEPLTDGAIRAQLNYNLRSTCNDEYLTGQVRQVLVWGPIHRHDKSWLITST